MSHVFTSEVQADFEATMAQSYFTDLELEIAQSILIENRLKPTSRILVICHNDLDGICSVIPLAQVFKNITFIDAKYTDVDAIVTEVGNKKAEFDFCFIVDISVNSINVLNSLGNKYLLIDHHDSAVALHMQGNCFVKNNCKSAALLLLQFVKAVFNKDISCLDKLAYLAHKYDSWTWWNFVDEANYVNDLYYHYGSIKFLERFKNGFTDFTAEEKDLIDARLVKFGKVFADTLKTGVDLSETLQCGKTVNTIMLFCDSFLNEVSMEFGVKYNANIIIIRKSNGTYSIRYYDNGIGGTGFHLGNSIQECYAMHNINGRGGGHANAAGFSIDGNPEQLQVVVEYLHDKLNNAIEVANGQ